MSQSMQPDERSIRQLHADWISAVNAGDLARLLGWMTDDVIFLGPGREPVGRDGFSAAYSAARKPSQIHCASDLQEVVVLGDIAYTRSRDALSVTPIDGEPAVRLSGHRLTIYRRQPSGPWLLARDAHTLTPMSG
jgi:uncharacterized protein (TIGR02246 family)